MLHNDTALFFKCSRGPISKILNKHNIKIISQKEHALEKAYEINCYNDQKILLKQFSSLGEAALYIQKNNPEIKINNATISIRSAILTNTKAFGFFWDSPNYSEKQKEDFKVYKLTKTKENKYKQKKHKCPICNKEIAHQSKLCRDCNATQRQIKTTKNREEKGITRDFLKQEIRNKPFTTIAKEQGVSDNAIRKWCKLYNLPSKSSEIKKYSDEEWKNI